MTCPDATSNDTVGLDFTLGIQHSYNCFIVIIICADYAAYVIG